MQTDQLNPLNDILTEKELLDLLGIKKDFLSRLRREKQFPFCKISETQRVYLSRDVVDYIKGKRMVMNSHKWYTTLPRLYIDFTPQMGNGF